jgi:hypothetical protein
MRIFIAGLLDGLIMFIWVDQGDKFLADTGRRGDN